MSKTDPQISSAFTEQDAALLLKNVLDTAQKQIETLVDGNGMHKSAVRISEKHLTLTPLDISCSCRFSVIEKETQGTGHQPTGTLLPGREALRDAINAHLDALLKNPDWLEKLGHFAIEKNFGLTDENNETFPPAHTAFYFEDKCQTCGGKGKSDCALCRGKGEQPCNQCHGQGRTSCFVCHGAKQTPRPDGGFEPCRQCNGHGSTPCPGCRESRVVPCNNCRNTGKTSCKACNGSGTKTIIITVDFKPEFRPRPDWPNGKPKDLPRDEHELISSGQFKFLKTPVKTEVTGDTVNWHFIGALPHGQIGFSLNGKRVDTIVTGVKGLITTDSLFLDSLVKPGIGALNKIVRGPMAAGALFQRARSYRMIRDVIDLVSHTPRKLVLQKLKTDYPIGLSDKYAKALIKLADNAVQKITVKPRWVGSILGSVVFGCVIFSWFHVLRPDFLKNAGLSLQLTLDGMLLGLGFVGTGYLIKYMSRQALKTMAGSAPDRLPAAGDQALASFGVLSLIFLASAATAAAPPLWWTQFF